MSGAVREKYKGGRSTSCFRILIVKGSLGKSKLDGKKAEIKDLLDKKVSKASIAKIYGVS